MKNRVRQSRTLGSVRGEDGAAMVNLHGHVAGNGGHGQGEPTVATGPLLLGVAVSGEQHRDDKEREDREGSNPAAFLAPLAAFAFLVVAGSRERDRMRAGVI